MKMEHRNPADRNEAILWARNILDRQQNYYILDTETTGLKKNDVIVQIAIIDMEGNVILDTLVKPTKRKRISEEATSIHGITMKHLKDMPTFAELVPQIKSLTMGKRVLIYNAEFDEKLIEQTIEQDDAPYFSMITECVMLQYSKFVGQWNDYYYEYRYQRLPAGDHSAVGDCKATLKVIEKMAEAELFDVKVNEPIRDSPKPKNIMEIVRGKENKQEDTLSELKIEKIELLPIMDKSTKKWWQFWK